MTGTLGIMDLGMLIGIALLALGAVMVLSAKTVSRIDTADCSWQDPALTGPAQDIHTCPVLEARAEARVADISKLEER